MDLFSNESIDTSSFARQKRKRQKGWKWENAFRREGAQCVACVLLSKNCILFAVNNALIPPERAFVSCPEFAYAGCGEKDLPQWRLILYSTHITTGNYYVNAKELVKNSEALLIGCVTFEGKAAIAFVKF